MLKMACEGYSSLDNLRMPVNQMLIMQNFLSSQRFSSKGGQKEHISSGFNNLEIESMIRYHLIADSRPMIRQPQARERVVRRARDFCNRVHLMGHASRLMMFARQAVMDADARQISLASGQVWWALSLSGAKGRMKRTWWARPGGIYLCLAIYQGLLREKQQLYSLAAGLSIAQVLREWGVNAELRWLNDVLVRGKKVAGILAETVNAPRLKESYLLTGIGINLNQEQFPLYLQASSTSLFLETGRKWPLFDLGSHILSRIALNFALLHDWEAETLGSEYSSQADSKPCPVIRECERLSGIAGRRVLYGLDLETGRGQAATAVRILPDGALSLHLDSGGAIKATVGEIRYL